MEWNIVLPTLLGAIVGGFFTLLGGAYQVKLSEKKQKEEDKKKIKLDVLTDIMGNRAALSDPQNSPLYKKDFFTALNRVTVAFSDNKKVTDLYEEFTRHMFLPTGKKNGNTSNELMYKLVKSMYEDLNIEVPSYDNFIAVIF